MKPYPLEEHDAAIIDAIKSGRLEEINTIVSSIDYFQAHNMGWWLINGISMCERNCTEYVHDLRRWDSIVYFIFLNLPGIEWRLYGKANE